MASNFFEASTIFKSPELKMKFMNFLSTTICQKHNIQSLVELDYGKHIIHDKILSQVHSRIISIPLTLTFEGSINNMTQYQAPICIPLQEILDSMLEQSHNMLMVLFRKPFLFFKSKGKTLSRPSPSRSDPYPCRTGWIFLLKNMVPMKKQQKIVKSRAII